ncbi:MAG: hypothetical protein JJ969_08485 [Rhizobiaceae bacterium]|nr:hypothetical protein [Rhizobiaceae bacterium]
MHKNKAEWHHAYSVTRKMLPCNKNDTGRNDFSIERTGLSQAVRLFVSHEE